MRWTTALSISIWPARCWLWVCARRSASLARLQLARALGMLGRVLLRLVQAARSGAPAARAAATSRRRSVSSCRASTHSRRWMGSVPASQAPPAGSAPACGRRGSAAPASGPAARMASASGASSRQQRSTSPRGEPLQQRGHARACRTRAGRRPAARPAWPAPRSHRSVTRRGAAQQPGRCLQGVRRRPHCASSLAPRWSQAMPPVSRRDSTSAKPACSMSAASSSGLAKRSTEAGRYA